MASSFSSDQLLVDAARESVRATDAAIIALRAATAQEHVSMSQLVKHKHQQLIDAADLARQLQAQRDMARAERDQAQEVAAEVSLFSVFRFR